MEVSAIFAFLDALMPPIVLAFLFTYFIFNESFTNKNVNFKGWVREQLFNTVLTAGFYISVLVVLKFPTLLRGEGNSIVQYLLNMGIYFIGLLFLTFVISCWLKVFTEAPLIGPILRIALARTTRLWLRHVKPVTAYLVQVTIEMPKYLGNVAKNHWFWLIDRVFVPLKSFNQQLEHQAQLEQSFLGKKKKKRSETDAESEDYDQASQSNASHKAMAKSD